MLLRDEERIMCRGNVRDWNGPEDPREEEVNPGPGVDDISASSV